MHPKMYILWFFSNNLKIIFFLLAIFISNCLCQGNLHMVKYLPQRKYLPYWSIFTIQIQLKFCEIFNVQKKAPMFNIKISTIHKIIDKGGISVKIVIQI